MWLWFDVSRVDVVSIMRATTETENRTPIVDANIENVTMRCDYNCCASVGNILLCLFRNESNFQHPELFAVQIGHYNLLRTFQSWIQIHEASRSYLHAINVHFSFLFPYQGIPELGIDHFEPLIIPSVHVSRGSGSLVLTGGFKNLIVKGPSNTTVSRAR